MVVLSVGREFELRVADLCAAAEGVSLTGLACAARQVTVTTRLFPGWLMRVRVAFDRSVLSFVGETVSLRTCSLDQPSPTADLSTRFDCKTEARSRQSLTHFSLLESRDG